MATNEHQPEIPSKLLTLTESEAQINGLISVTLQYLQRIFNRDTAVLH